MDSKNPETSEKTEDLSEEENYSKDISDEKHKQSPQKPTRTKSEEQRLSSKISSKSSRLSAHTSTSSSKDPGHKIELDETPSSRDTFISSRSLRSRTKCSRNLDAIISPRKNLTVPFSPDFLHSGPSGGNVSCRSRSSLGEESDTHFLSPEGVAGRVTRSHSKVLAETNTPSPDKRSVEVQTPTPTKKIRKGPERSSGRFRSKQESCKSRLSTSTGAKTAHKSPTDVQTLEKRPSKKVENLEPLTPALVGKRKRKTIISSSEESETASGSYKSKLRSPSSGSNIAHKSPSNVQTQESKPDVETVGQSSIKITKAQEQSLISSKETPLTSNDLGSTPETLTLRPSRSSPRILNPHVFSSPSKIADSGIETKTFERCQTSPKTLNPPSLSSCHSPRKKDSIIYTPRRKYESSDGKSEKDANPSFACTLQTSTSKTTTYTSTSGSLGMLRGFGSDETLTVGGQYDESNSVTVSASSDRSRSLSEMAEDIDPQFRSILPRCASTDRSPTRNKVQVQGGNDDPFLQRRVGSISDDVFISGNRQTGMSDINAPHIDVSETEVSTSKNEPLIEDYLTVQSQSSTLENSPVGSNNCPSDIVLDLLEMESSTSSCQPVTTDDYGTSSDDLLDSSSDVPGAIEQFAPSGNEGFPAHHTEARQLLRSVMKAMLLHIKEDKQLKIIESLFDQFSPFSSKEDVRDLYIYLITYVGSRKKDLWVKSRFMSQNTKLEAYLEETYEKLLTMVIETFASTLAVRSYSDFDEIILHYQKFKTFYDIFSGYWNNTNIDDVKDKGCRNNLKNLKEKIERYMLVVQSAFQHLLTYVGERAKQKSLAIYEDKLSELDKKFLRRKY